MIYLGWLYNLFIIFDIYWNKCLYVLQAGMRLKKFSCNFEVVFLFFKSYIVRI